jgi:hypothetical protein
MRFTDLSLDKFWISVKEEYSAIHRKAINTLLQFSTSYRCEQAFISFPPKMKSVCAYPKFNQELGISAAKKQAQVSR